jgi:hypothetical protein
MPGPPLSDDLARESVEAYKAHGFNKALAARSLGLIAETFRSRLKIAAERGMLLDLPPAMPGFRIAQVTTQPDGGKHIQQKPERGEKFEVPHGQIIKGVSALIDEDGREIVKWVKTKEDAEATLATMRAVADELKKDLPRIVATPGPKLANAQLLNQYTVTDYHFGMLAWAEETRDADWDLKIAEKLFLDWFSAAIATAPDAKVGVLAQLGDLMHHDALESVTPAHRNVLDADSRLQKIIRVVIRVLRQVIAMLLERHQRVHIIMASGNHDPASSAWLREMLHAMYQGEKRLTIDNSPDIYYAYEWGRTALFYHHGHKAKITEVAPLFASKFRELYGRAAQSYGHMGHHHHNSVDEPALMPIEQHRTLAPRDAHGNSKWIAGRDAKVITYHREFGEVYRSTLSPKMVQRK